MKNYLKSAIFEFVFIALWPSLAEASTCRVHGSVVHNLAANFAAALAEFDHNLTIKIKGKDLPSRISETQGTALLYSGPAAGGFLSYGPYYSQRGSQVIVEPSIVLSTEWRPDTYHTCSKRNWKNQCISWNQHYYESGFTIDYMVDGDVIYSVILKDKMNLKKEAFDLPSIECKGNLNDLEVRVHSAYGGAVNFNIHELRLSTLWND